MCGHLGVGKHKPAGRKGGEKRKGALLILDHSRRTSVVNTGSAFNPNRFILDTPRRTKSAAA